LVCGLNSQADEAAVQALMDAFAGYTAYATETTARRRAEPTDDLFSILVNAQVDGQRMSDDEIVFETLLILIGGDETTRHTLSGGTEQLLRHPDQWRRLVDDPELIPTAAEEMLRWTSPVKNMCRTLTADTEFHGTELREGEKVMLMFESANFDEAVFGDPENFRIDRNPNNHLAFGFGTHFCLGNQLARLELTTMLRTILTRLPDLRLAPDFMDSALPLRPANFVSGLEAMPVVFTPSAPVLV
jgi:cytochrome P450 family 142 subfamily A polypeptide 1